MLRGFRNFHCGSLLVIVHHRRLLREEFVERRRHGRSRKVLIVRESKGREEADEVWEQSVRAADCCLRVPRYPLWASPKTGPAKVSGVPAIIRRTFRGDHANISVDTLIKRGCTRPTASAATAAQTQSASVLPYEP